MPNVPDNHLSHSEKCWPCKVTLLIVEAMENVVGLMEMDDPNIRSLWIPIPFSSLRKEEL